MIRYKYIYIYIYIDKPGLCSKEMIIMLGYTKHTFKSMLVSSIGCVDGLRSGFG